MAKRRRLGAPGFGSGSGSETGSDNGATYSRSPKFTRFPGPATSAREAGQERGNRSDVSDPGALETKSARPPIAAIAADTARTAALEQVADEMALAQLEGRVMTKIPLEAIQSDYLIRDRVIVDEDEMEILEASIATRGQKTPLEVVALEDGRYGLISGWRRLTALRRLQERAIGPDMALALIRSLKTAPDAYTAMVEENEIRVGLTYFERASIVLQSLKEGVFETEKQALNVLFSTASRAKRSKVKSFLPVVAAIGPVLQHPHVLTERIGLALSARMAQEDRFARKLWGIMDDARPRSAEAETALLQDALKVASPPTPSPSDTPPSVQVSRRKGKMTLSGAALSSDLMDAIEALIADWQP